MLYLKAARIPRNQYLVHLQNGLRRLRTNVLFVKRGMDAADIGAFIIQTGLMRDHVKTLMDGDINVAMGQRSMGLRNFSR